MKSVEEVKTSGKLIALVFRKNIKVDGVKFLTSQSNSFQIGIHKRKKGVNLSPHAHKLDKPLTIKSIQEILYVVEGKIRVSLFSEKGNKISGKTLSTGDSILLISGGHGVNFLENSKIFEVKQGPYPGVANAKVFF